MTQTQRLRYTTDGATWRETVYDYAWAAGIPTNPRWTNMGSYWDQINLAWDQQAYAEYYNVYVAWTGQGKYLRAQTPYNNYTLGMGPDTNHQLWVASVSNRGVESAHSGPHQVRSGHPQATIAGGTGYVSSGMDSVNRFRQGSWGYGGSNQPYWGWFDTEAYRYTSLYEINPETMWQTVANAYPSLGPYRNSVGSTGFGWFVTRGSGVGSYSSAINIHVSLADGISYGSGTEPPQQGNVQSINIQGTGSGNVGYSMPGNWPQAIYQYHSNYMGLLIRPYYNGGGRVPYGATTAGGSWDLSISWGTIVTQNQQNTTAW